jgi:GntR family transcriptional regulator
LKSIEEYDLDKNSSIPLYYQVEQMIKDMIDSDQLLPGQRAPSERELAETFGISRMTVRAAMSNLVADGYLYSVLGKGTFVASPKMHQNLLDLTSFTEDMRRRGLKPGARLLEMGISNEASSKVYRVLGLAEHEELIRIYRLRTADGEPMCLETSYLLRDLFPWLFEEDLESGSLYRALESRGIELTRAEEQLEATVVRETESQLLTVPVGYPALLIERTTYTTNDKPIEYVKSLYRGDRYQFSVTLLSRKARKGNRP